MKREQEVDDEVDQNWTAACELTAKRMLKYLEDSEVLKVSTRELKEQVLSPDESCALRGRREVEKQTVVPGFQTRSKRGPLCQYGLVGGASANVGGAGETLPGTQGRSGAFKRKTKFWLF